MRFKDRTNIKYGKLTAIEYMGKSMWKCKCDCGNEKIIFGGHLENGHTKSCGCFRSPRTNLENQVFGKLTVKNWEGNGKWKCVCECGAEVLVQTDNLKNGNTKSCGCLQKQRASETSFISLIGNRYGKLIVQERVENNRFGHTCYKCKCDCGGTVIVDASNLRQGTTNSCGCIKSKGEMVINNWLSLNNVNFQAQYSHNEIVLKSGRRPFFDFAIFDKENNLLCFIEYQGKQHYEITGGWNDKEQFEITRDRDNQKKEWCKKLKIQLYEIKYTDDIEETLKKILKNFNCQEIVE